MLSYVNKNDSFAIIKFDITFIIYEPRRDMAGIENNFLKLNTVDNIQNNSSKTAINSSTTRNDPRMSKNGSIFEGGAPGSLNKIGQSQKNYNVSDAQKAAAEAENKQRAGIGEVRGFIGDSKEYQSQAISHTKDAASIDKELKNEQKTLGEDLKNYNKFVEAEKKAQNKLFEEIKQNDNQINIVQNKLKLETEKNNLNADGTFAPSGEQSQINGLVAELDSLDQTSQTLNVKLKSGKKSANSEFRLISRSSKNVNRLAKQRNAAVKSADSTNSQSISSNNIGINISQTLDKTGQKTSATGGTLKTLGQTLKSNPYTAAAGEALDTAGKVMDTAGKVMSGVGQTGVAIGTMTSMDLNTAGAGLDTASTTADGTMKFASSSSKTSKASDKELQNTMKKSNKSLQQIKQSMQLSNQLVAALMQDFV